MIDDRRAALVERLEDAAGYASKEHAAIMREAAADLDLIRAEVDRLRAALEELIWYTNQLELDVYDPKEWPDEHSAVTQARAALGGDT